MSEDLELESSRQQRLSKHVRGSRLHLPLLASQACWTVVPQRLCLGQGPQPQTACQLIQSCAVTLLWAWLHNSTQIVI